jgi:hypothetical protein
LAEIRHRQRLARAAGKTTNRVLMAYTVSTTTPIRQIAMAKTNRTGCTSQALFFRLLLLKVRGDTVGKRKRVYEWLS